MNHRDTEAQSNSIHLLCVFDLCVSVPLWFTAVSILNTDKPAIHDFIVAPLKKTKLLAAGINH